MSARKLLKIFMKLSKEPGIISYILSKMNHFMGISHILGRKGLGYALTHF